MLIFGLRAVSGADYLGCEHVRRLDIWLVSVCYMIRHTPCIALLHATPQARSPNSWHINVNVLLGFEVGVPGPGSVRVPY